MKISSRTHHKFISKNSNLITQIVNIKISYIMCKTKINRMEKKKVIKTPYFNWKVSIFGFCSFNGKKI
jgi:hypothetical protein